MHNLLYRWLEPRATPRALVVGVLLWIASALGVVALQTRVASRSGGLPVPDVWPFYTPGDLYGLLEQYGEPGRQAFLEFALYDVFYPFVAYGIAALALAAFTRSLVEAHRRWSWIVLVPLAGLVVELLEQIGFLLILAFFPIRVEALAFVVSVLTPLKFLVIAGVVCFLAVLGVWRALGVRAA